MYKAWGPVRAPLSLQGWGRTGAAGSRMHWGPKLERERKETRALPAQNLVVPSSDPKRCDGALKQDLLWPGGFHNGVSLHHCILLVVGGRNPKVRVLETWLLLAGWHLYRGWPDVKGCPDISISSKSDARWCRGIFQSPFQPYKL